MGDKAHFTSTKWSSSDDVKYRLTCPYCGGRKFFYDVPDSEDEWDMFESHEYGDEVTCIECSRSFLITENCYKPDDNGT